MGWEGFAAVSLTQLNEGDLIGKCRVIRLLGVGGMGSVYLARHTMLDIEVALKVVSPSLARENPALAQRFIREAQVAARIRHPHVVVVMDADTDLETGLAYLVLEFLPGGSLADLLKEGALPEKRAVRILAEIAEALRCAADNGIAHRDIKPGNIMFDSGGNAKLADLGLARLLNGPAVNVTQDGAAIGTPAYMSPQHIQDARAADAQDDLYSLGATFFEAVTGRPPFAGDTPYNVISAILSQPTPDPKKFEPRLSPGAAAICRKLMAKAKPERYETAAALLLDVRALQRGETPSVLRGKDRETRRVSARTGLETGTSFKDQAFLLGSIAFCLFVVYAFWPEAPPAPVVQTLPVPTPVAVAPTPAPVEIRRAEAVTPADLAALSPTPEPVFPTQAPEPMAPDLSRAGSFLEVKRVADVILSAQVRGSLIRAIGFRTKDSALPTSWRLFYFDTTARQNVRLLTVENLMVKEVIDGYVELRKLRISAYKPSEVIDLTRVRYDSADALRLLLAREELHGVSVAESICEINARNQGSAPFWKITLFAKDEESVIDLGHARLSAETGDVLETDWDEGRIERVRKRVQPITVSEP